VPVFGKIVRSNVSIEDRDLHMKGSMLEVDDELMRLSQNLSRVTLIDKETSKERRLPFSVAMLAKGMTLP